MKSATDQVGCPPPVYRNSHCLNESEDKGGTRKTTDEGQHEDCYGEKWDRSLDGGWVIITAWVGFYVLKDSVMHGDVTDDGEARSQALKEWKPTLSVGDQANSLQELTNNLKFA
jgi:hypothetical protein